MQEPLKEIALSELRLKWHEYLLGGAVLNSDDIRRMLRDEGLKAKGPNRKAEIRNIHGAASSDSSNVKVSPGSFKLI